MNHKNRVPLPSWAGKNKNDTFLRIPHSSLNHHAVKALSSNAFRLWIYLLRHADEDGYVDCATSQAPSMSGNTYLVARKMLIEGGFMLFINKDEASDKRKAARFKLIDDWHKSKK